MLLQPSHCESVPMDNHLIEKKIEHINTHFTQNGMEPTEPDICLLCNRRVEIPTLPILTKQLWKIGRVTMCLTEFIGHGVLA